MASSTDDVKRGHSIGEIENWNLDRGVDPPTKVVGAMYKSGGAWSYWDGTIDSGSISAKSGDAGLFRVSALGVDIADVSNADAADFRVSSIDIGRAFTQNQISILSASSTEIVAPNTSRKIGVMVTNHSSDSIWLGTSAVTTSNGVLLVNSKGSNITIPTVSAVYGIVSGTAQTVSYVEL